MSWIRSGGSSAKPANRTDGGATPPSRFRVEALEPRLLLSGDPLDLLKAPLEPQIAPEPAAVVESQQQNAAPTIDWGAAEHDTLGPTNDDSHTTATAPTASDDAHPVAADTAVTETAAQVAAASDTTTTAVADTTQTIGDTHTDAMTTQASDTHDARGPPASNDANADVSSPSS